MMRSILTYSVAVLATFSSLSQNKQLLYGLESVPQSLLLNPGGEIDAQKHFGIPFFSGFHINAGTSGVNVYDIFGNDTGDINTKIRDKISDLSDKDFFTITQQIELLNFGWRSQEGTYFSAGWYGETDFIAYFPKDVAVLATEGNRDYINVPFDIGQISARGDATSVFHFGMNKQLSRKLTIGGRAKLYSSLISVSSTNNTGTINTVPSENGLNVYEHRLSNIDFSFQSAGLTSLTALSGDRAGITTTVMGRALFSGNYGLGVDVGFTYQLTDKVRLSASALDIGAIFHVTDTDTYRIQGDYTLNGIELVFPPIEDGEFTLPYYNDLEDEIDRELKLDTISKSYVQTRPLKVHAQLAYNFGKFIGGAACDCLEKGRIRRVNEMGVHLYVIKRPKGPQTAGTFFYRRRFGTNFSLKGTYTVDSYSKDNVGAAMVMDIGKFNFYIAADNLLRYENLAKANSVSLQLGLNLKWDQ
jgi:hypothetical protein